VAPQRLPAKNVVLNLFFTQVNIEHAFATFDVAVVRDLPADAIFSRLSERDGPAMGRSADVEHKPI